MVQIGLRLLAKAVTVVGLWRAFWGSRGLSSNVAFFDWLKREFQFLRSANTYVSSCDTVLLVLNGRGPRKSPN